MQAVIYNLIAVTTNAFMGTYPTLDSCNKAIRAVIEKETVPVPALIPKIAMIEIQRSIDLTVKYQRKYVCVKAN